VPEAPETETPSALVGYEGRRVVGLVFAVVAPVTLISALAYYFGYRREEAFAGYFGIDQSTLGLTSNQYVLQSVDALFVPITVVLLVAFGAVFLHALAGDRLDRWERVNVTPIVVFVGLCALVLGIALLAGDPIASGYGYLQALGPAIGVTLLLYALVRTRSVSRHALAGAFFVGIALVVVSLFWATSDYANSRGLSEARRLAHDITVDPAVTIYSKKDLAIHPLAPGSGAGGKCAVLRVQHFRTGAYRFAYSGFTFLLQSGGNYFVTPTGGDPRTHWDASRDSVFIIPVDSDTRIALTRGSDYARNALDEAAQGHLAFTC
jgi:hypothetical protein